MLDGIKRARPSPALLVAIVALVAALGGSAVADVASTSKLNKKEKQQTKKIAKKQAKKAVAGIPAGPAGPKGERGDTGPAGTPFQAIALVNRSTPTPSFSSEVSEVGFESVTSGGTGIYCIVPSAGIDPAADPPFITIEYDGSSGENFTAMWDQATGTCADGSYEIQTYKADTNALTDNARFAIMVP